MDMAKNIAMDMAMDMAKDIAMFMAMYMDMDKAPRRLIDSGYDVATPTLTTSKMC